MAEAPRIALVRCDDYELERVEAAARRAVDLLGGMGAYVSAGQRVALKPNLLRPIAPERAVTTHPALVAAVARMVAEQGAKPVIVESPGGPYTPALLRVLYRKTGMEWAAEVGGAELNLDVGTVYVSHPGGSVLKRIELAAAATSADVIINLPKLKTHNLTVLTLAVKNLFGLVPGTIKIGYHGKLQNSLLFSQGLVDIATRVRPALNIVDAVMAMEGNGPSGGDRRALHALLAGADPFAVDVACATLVGYDPLRVTTTAAAAELGLTDGDAGGLEWVGDPLSALQVADFRAGAATGVDPGLVPRAFRGLLGRRSEDGAPARSPMEARVTAWFGRQLVALPVAGERCTGCGYCAHHCPVDAITIRDGRAHMDHNVCIRCYCCHELCPETAIALRRPAIGRVLLGA